MRYALRDGHYRVYGRTPPPPPPEWPPWKKEKLATCIQAAYLFLVKELDGERIARKLGRSEVTKQRISQWVIRGCQFFLDREYVRRVSSKS